MAEKAGPSRRSGSSERDIKGGGLDTSPPLREGGSSPLPKPYYDGWQLWEIKRTNPSETKESLENIDKHASKLGSLVKTDAELTECLNHFSVYNLHKNTEIAYGFFKKDIKPTVEDEDNYSGHRFYFYRQHLIRKNLEDAWKTMCQYLMNQTFIGEGCRDQINGARIRWQDFDAEDDNAYKLQIWGRGALSPKSKVFIEMKIPDLFLGTGKVKVIHEVQSGRRCIKRIPAPSQNVPVLTPLVPRKR